MNKRQVLGAMVFFWSLWGSTAAAVSLQGGAVNRLDFTYYESLFDSSGRFKIGDLAVADTLVGILKVERIRAGGQTIFTSGPQNQLTGIYAHQVIALPPYSAGPFVFLDPHNPASPLAHASFGTTDLTTLTLPDQTTVDLQALLGPGGMLTLWSDQGPAATPFGASWSMAEDLDRATDGSPYLRLGLGSGGYFYGHTLFPDDPASLSKGTFHGGLDDLFNATGSHLAWLNDPLEQEIDAFVKLYLDGTIGINPGFSQNSLWLFTGSGTATILPAPEPATWLLLSVGLCGIIGLQRQKKKAAARQRAQTRDH